MQVLGAIFSKPCHNWFDFMILTNQKLCYNAISDQGVNGADFIELNFCNDHYKVHKLDMFGTLIVIASTK